MYTEPKYRVDMYASDDFMHQQIINIFRRLLGLPVKKTGAQAAEELRQRYIKA